MRWGPSRLSVWGAVAVIGTVPAMTGCSSADRKAPPPPLTPSSATAAAGAPRPSTVSLSPAGVTTKIDVPAHSTEEEYFQACHAANVWMHGHPGDRQALVESYLATLQRPGVVGPGTWNIAWTALSLPRRAGVIVAAKAAANDECG
jgi:hypothetical protein